MEKQLLKAFLFHVNTFSLGLKYFNYTRNLFPYHPPYPRSKYKTSQSNQLTLITLFFKPYATPSLLFKAVVKALKKQNK